MRQKNVLFTPRRTIYNKINDKFATALKNPATGTVKVLDTNRDDKYDIVFINEYVNYVVDYVSTVSLKVSIVSIYLFLSSA